MENGTNSDYNPAIERAWEMSVWCTVAFFILGFPANICVLFHLQRSMKENIARFKTGSGLPLFVMTISDIISMCTKLLQKTLAYYLPLFIDIEATVGPDSWTNYICKGLVYIPATLTSTTTWIWLILSAQRYLIVRHQLLPLHARRPPYREITAIFIISALVNSWTILIHFLAYNAAANTYVCSYNDFQVNGVILTGWLVLARCIWAFFLPFPPTCFMDIMVFMCPLPLDHAPEDSRRNVGGQSTAMRPIHHEESRGLRKWLLIALIDIMLNAPINISRLIYFIFEDRLNVESHTPLADFYYIFMRFGEVLDYLQYTLNPLYLCLFIFDKSNPHDALRSAAQNVPLIERRCGCPQECSSIEQLHEEQLKSHKSD